MDHFPQFLGTDRRVVRNQTGNKSAPFRYMGVTHGCVSCLGVPPCFLVFVNFKGKTGLKPSEEQTTKNRSNTKNNEPPTRCPALPVRCRHIAADSSNSIEKAFGCGSKLNDRRTNRRFWSMFPLTRVSFWYRFLEPQPFGCVLPARNGN